jgi:hypothetical protein
MKLAKHDLRYLGKEEEERPETIVRTKYKLLGFKLGVLKNNVKLNQKLIFHVAGPEMFIHTNSVSSYTCFGLDLSLA